MKKILSATAALGVFAVLGAGTAQADTIDAAKVWVNQANAGPLAGCVAPAAPGCFAPPLAGNLVPGSGSEISFNLTSSLTNPSIGTVSQFAAATPGTPWAVVGNPPLTNAAFDATALSNGANPGTGTIFEFTGTVTNTTLAAQVLDIFHDDGVVGMVGLMLINAPGAQGPTHTPAGMLGPGAAVAFDLIYGECCTLPAVFEFTKGGVNVTNTPGVPEPTSLALLGSALVGFGVWRRRRRTS
jgi:hypothetical protein